MKIADVIKEDTMAGNVASVSIPLGKAKMVRRAVDPKGYLNDKKDPIKIQSVYPERKNGKK